MLSTLKTALRFFPCVNGLYCPVNGDALVMTLFFAAGMVGRSEQVVCGIFSQLISSPLAATRVHRARGMPQDGSPGPSQSRI